MKKLMICVVCGMLAGCDYNVPLVKAPGMNMDSALVGSWQRTKEDGQTESLLVLPLSKQEYMVSFPAGSKDSMFAKACLCKTAEQTLVQLEWVGTAKGATPENSRIFQFASCTVDGNTLIIRMLNADVVNKEAKSTEELTKAIADSKDKTDLFREKMVFTKIKN